MRGEVSWTKRWREREREREREVRGRRLKNEFLAPRLFLDQKFAAFHFFPLHEQGPPCFQAKFKSLSKSKIPIFIFFGAEFLEQTMVRH